MSDKEDTVYVLTVSPEILFGGGVSQAVIDCVRQQMPADSAMLVAVDGRLQAPNYSAGSARTSHIEAMGVIAALLRRTP